MGLYSSEGLGLDYVWDSIRPKDSARTTYGTLFIRRTRPRLRRGLYSSEGLGLDYVGDCARTTYGTLFVRRTRPGLRRGLRSDYVWDSIRPKDSETIHSPLKRNGNVRTRMDPVTNKINLCKDCAYYMPDSIIRAQGLTRCAHPTTTTNEPILGKSSYVYAYVQRDPKGPCGPSGNLFVPETSQVKRLLRGRGAYIYGALYVSFMGTMIYRMSRW
jgi:hypothetical protein